MGGSSPGIKAAFRSSSLFTSEVGLSVLGVSGMAFVRPLFHWNSRRKGAGGEIGAVAVSSGDRKERGTFPSSRLDLRRPFLPLTKWARFPSSSYLTKTRHSGSGSAWPFVFFFRCLCLPGGLLSLSAPEKGCFGLLGRRASGIVIDESGQGFPGLLFLIQSDVTFPQKKKGLILVQPFREFLQQSFKP